MRGVSVPIGGRAVVWALSAACAGCAVVGSYDFDGWNPGSSEATGASGGTGASGASGGGGAGGGAGPNGGNATVGGAGGGTAECGNNVIEPPEACDDGNSDTGDGCEDCQIECPERGCFAAPALLAALDVHSLDVGLFDLDGTPDLVVASNTGQMLYLAGDGTGSGFTASQLIGSETYVRLSAADINRDNHSDFVVCPLSGSCQAWIGGSMVPMLGTFVSTVTNVVEVQLAQVDGKDEFTDCIIGSTTGFQVLQGLGTFDFAETVSVSGISPRALVGADVDGDADLDVVLVTATGVRTAVQIDPFAFDVPVVEAPLGSDSVAVASGDLDGDAYADVVVADSAGAYLSVLHGSSNGLGGSAFVPTTGSALAMTMANVTGDSRSEVVVATSLGTVEIYRVDGPGDGSLALLASYPGLSGTPRVVRAAPVTVRGALDVLVGTSTGVFALLHQDVTD